MARNSAIFDPVAHWPEWTDILGQKYKAGDYVAYASISGKSPQMVIARVVRINRIDSKKQEIVTWKGTHPNRVAVPSCNVTVIPVLDARGFYRSNTRFNPQTRAWDSTGENRPVTLQLIKNLIKIDWTPPNDPNAP